MDPSGFKLDPKQKAGIPKTHVKKASGSQKLHGGRWGGGGTFKRTFTKLSKGLSKGFSKGLSKGIPKGLSKGFT